MPKATLKMHSWQVFHYARKHLKASVLCNCFGKKNARAVDYWCQNPSDTARPEGSYDPIKGVKLLLEYLDDHGHCAVVKSCLSYLSAGTSACCEFSPKVEDLKPTMAEEILADYSAVAQLQQAIEAGQNVAAIQSAKAAAIAEIERTVALYLSNKGDSNA